MNATDKELPYRIADTYNHGWLTRGDGVYEGFDPTRQFGEARLAPRPIVEIEAEFGPWRPVVSPTDDELDELRSAFELAGRKAIGSIASALETVHFEARERFGPWDADTHATAAYAQRTLTAGRPGSWEAAAVMEVIYFGNDLNLHPHKQSLPVEHMRSTGPNPKRVDLDARARIAAVLRAWVASTDRYTEVPENLAAQVGSYADQQHGADGWRAIADQWLQPGGLDKDNFIGTYQLLYSSSRYFDPSQLG